PPRPPRLPSPGTCVLSESKACTTPRSGLFWQNKRLDLPNSSPAAARQAERPVEEEADPRARVLFVGGDGAEDQEGVRGGLGARPLREANSMPFEHRRRSGGTAYKNRKERRFIQARYGLRFRRFARSRRRRNCSLDNSERCASCSSSIPPGLAIA